MGQSSWREIDIELPHQHFTPPPTPINAVFTFLISLTSAIQATEQAVVKSSIFAAFSQPVLIGHLAISSGLIADCRQGHCETLFVSSQVNLLS
jgi:hypothetical protein